MRVHRVLTTGDAAYGHRSAHTDRYTGSLRTQESLLPEVTYGEYAARCDCRTTFRNTPEGVLPKAKYDNKVRDLVLGRLLNDGMNIERALESLRREFLLDLSSGFVYDGLARASP